MLIIRFDFACRQKFVDQTLVAEIMMLNCLLYRRLDAIFILPFVAVVQEKVIVLFFFCYITRNDFFFRFEVFNRLLMNLVNNRKRFLCSLCMFEY